MRKWELSVNSSACLCSGQYGLTVETMHLVSAALLSVTEQPERRAAEKSVILLTIKYRIPVSVVRHSHICLATKYSAVIQLDRLKPKIYIILFMFHVKWNESEMNERYLVPYTDSEDCLANVRCRMIDISDFYYVRYWNAFLLSTLSMNSVQNLLGLYISNMSCLWMCENSLKIHCYGVKLYFEVTCGFTQRKRKKWY